MAVEIGSLTLPCVLCLRLPVGVQTMFILPWEQAHKRENLLTVCLWHLLSAVLRQDFRLGGAGNSPLVCFVVGCLVLFWFAHCNLLVWQRGVLCPVVSPSSVCSDLQTLFVVRLYFFNAYTGPSSNCCLGSWSIMSLHHLFCVCKPIFDNCVQQCFRNFLHPDPIHNRPYL